MNIMSTQSSNFILQNTKVNNVFYYNFLLQFKVY